METGDIFRYLIAPAAGAVILWELWTGKALNRNWDIVALRAEKPASYWANVVIQCVAVVAALLLLEQVGW